MKKKIKTRRKGSNAERELVRILKGKGIDCERVGMSGQLRGLKGDLRISIKERGLFGLQAEVKKFKRKFQEYSWLEKDSSDIVFKRSDNEKWLVVVPLDLFVELAK